MTDTPDEPHAGILAALLKNEPSERDHYEAFGQFVATFALAEAQIHTLGRHLSGTTDRKARLLFNGFRLKDTIDRIKPFIRIEQEARSLLDTPQISEAEAEAILDCLKQIQIISDVRGRLVHRVSNYIAGAGIRVTNSFTAAQFLLLEDQTITLQNLIDLRADCGLIFLRLSAFRTPGGPISFDALTPLTWQYKPPQPASPGNKPPKNKKGRSPRPQS